MFNKNKREFSYLIIYVIAEKFDETIKLKKLGQLFRQFIAYCVRTCILYYNHRMLEHCMLHFTPLALVC